MAPMMARTMGSSQSSLSMYHRNRIGRPKLGKQSAWGKSSRERQRSHRGASEHCNSRKSCRSAFLFAAFVVALSTVVTIEFRIGNVAIRETQSDTEAYRNRPLSLETTKRKAAEQTKEQSHNAEADKVMTRPAKFLTYDRYPGRLNNQLFQFVSALQHAVLINRTLIVPPEILWEHWTGMFDGDLVQVWDIAGLNANYHIDWTTAHSQPIEVEQKCRLRPSEFQRLLSLSDSQKWDDCPTIHIGGSGGLLFCSSQHRFCGDATQERVAYDIYKHIKLSKPVMDLVPRSPDGSRYELAVHSRTHHHKPPFPAECCVNGNRKTCKAHIPASLHDWYCDEYTMEANCNMWTDLLYEIHSESARSALSRGGKFVLANDGTHDWSIEYPKNQCVTTTTDPLKPTFSAAIDGDPKVLEQKVKSPYLRTIFKNKRKFQYEINRLTQSIIDIYSLVDANYFAGNIFSTFSLSACLLRGEERKNDSNMCWMLMHPGEKFATLPPGYKPNKPKDTQTKDASGTAPKCLTYARPPGNLYDQLFQFVSALQHATLLNRTLIVPPEKIPYQWTGMFDGDLLKLWDISGLNANYHIDWTTSQSRSIYVDESCRLHPSEFHQLLSPSSEKWDRCPTVHIGGDKGLLFCGAQHRFCGDVTQERVAYDIYKHIKLKKSVKDLLPRRKHRTRFELAVDSRTHQRNPPFPADACVRGNAKTCRSHLGPLHETYCDDYTMRANCNMWTNLAFELHSASARSALSGGSTFVLASDGSHDWSEEYPSDWSDDWSEEEPNNQYVTASSDPLIPELSASVEGGQKVLEEKDKSPYLQSIISDKTKVVSEMNRLTQSIMEMFSLVDATYFVGNIYSTVSLSACLLRGEKRKNDSNMCWMLMHPGEQHANPPPNYIQNKPEKEKEAKKLKSKYLPFKGGGKDVQRTAPVSGVRDTDRVYCMVPYIWTPDSIARYEEILETWGKRCDTIRFMIDPIVGDATSGFADLREMPQDTLLDNIVVINMTRPWNACGKKPCRHIWEKMWRSWVWVDENERDKADWFVKVDWDTYFFPENLSSFVQRRGWKPDEHHYFGHRLYHRKYPLIVGAAVIFSSATLHSVAEVYRNMPSDGMRDESGKCVDRAFASEEVSTSICLKEELGIAAEDTLDSEGREHIMGDNFDLVLKWNRTEQGEWWFWQGKANGTGHCCADKPIAFHNYKTVGKFRRLEKQFYGPDGNKKLASLDSTARHYVEKVRKAMSTPTTEMAVCQWQALENSESTLIVASSHPISDGTAFVVRGNITNARCQNELPLRVLTLSDPKDNNNFDIHRVDCPPGIPLLYGGGSCPPAVRRPREVASSPKNVICLAPLYNSRNTRWLIEWLLYHQILGFDKVVVPSYDITGDSKRVLEYFANKGLVEIVPWGPGDTNGLVRDGHIYEHGKLFAWNRCYLEHAEKADWMVFVDIDEMVQVATTLQDAFDWMDKNGDGKRAFSLKNKALLSVLDETKEDQLLVAQYNGMELKGLCPYNCGTYHLGRWKYFVRGGEILNELLWTHSISGLNYTRAGEIMELVPDDVAFIRHYQAHWYQWEKANGHPTEEMFKTKQSPLPSGIVHEIQKRVENEFKEMYAKAAPGLSWVKR